jgi:Cu+-exporting ATPase
MMKSQNSDRVQDPVCGMQVKPDSPYRTVFRGREFAFCSPHCLDRFQKEPERYLGVAGAGESEAVAPGNKGEIPATYLTCPMHPEVKELAPRCPKCGMFLERPTEPQVEEEKPAQASVVSGVDYTCPMHPEVCEPKPGACPKCGMALELAGAPAAPVTKTEWTCWRERRPTAKQSQNPRSS